jgi:exo-beta-1,3-glucanase (GH17 family)
MKRTQVINVYEESFVTVTEELLPTPTAEAPRVNVVAATPPEPSALLPPVPQPAVKAAVFSPEAADSGAEARLAVVLTPFAGSPDAVDCKSQDTVNGEFADLASKGFVRFRYHGTDCNQAFMANTAAQRTNTEVFLGAFNLRNVVAETQDLIRQVQASGGWERVHMVALGNEDLSKGMSAAEAVQQIQIGTDMLRAAGYSGDIVHPETVDNVLNNRAIMCSPAAGTKLAINVFPFNNPNVAADEAGQEAARQTQLISECSREYSSRAPGNDVVLSEAGWPGFADGSNGAAVASPDAQIRAISAIVSTVPAEQYLFTAYDHTWQRDFAGSHGAEQHYGLFGKGYSWNWPQLRSVRSRLIHGRA